MLFVIVIRTHLILNIYEVFNLKYGTEKYKS